MNVDEIDGSFFIDTNILLYSFDSTAPKKAATARAIIEHALRTRRGMISSQVMQEFLNAATRKFSSAFHAADLRLYFRTVLVPLCGHYVSDETLDHDWGKDPVRRAIPTPGGSGNSAFHGFQ